MGVDWDGQCDGGEGWGLGMTMMMTMTMMMMVRWMTPLHPPASLLRPSSCPWSKSLIQLRRCSCQTFHSLRTVKCTWPD